MTLLLNFQHTLKWNGEKFVVLLQSIHTQSTHSAQLLSQNLIYTSHVTLFNEEQEERNGKPVTLGIHPLQYPDVFLQQLSYELYIFPVKKILRPLYIG